ncbi:hypothetical protein QQ008_26700 [Fulvivirgaceae bacterium BMA10]|uniref:Uncharacterized protein n=1 Tax=Splendidivirga corallicola TaxID=3051826 RepID=A0ABT8KZK0_9BACT|nr:hypothetical protein [Fulvivirgaceae bacterium BMA10]
MKPSKKQFALKLAALALLVAAFVGNGIPTMGASADSTKNNKKKKPQTEITQEDIDLVLEDLNIESNSTSEDVNHIMIYDKDDNLIYECSWNQGEGNQCEKFHELMFKSDFVMEFNNTAYYTVN